MFRAFREPRPEVDCSFPSGNAIAQLAQRRQCTDEHVPATVCAQDLTYWSGTNLNISKPLIFKIPDYIADSRCVGILLVGNDGLNLGSNPGPACLHRSKGNVLAGNCDGQIGMVSCTFSSWSPSPCVSKYAMYPIRQPIMPKAYITFNYLIDQDQMHESCEAHRHANAHSAQGCNHARRSRWHL